TPTEIPLKAVYSDDAVDRSTVNRWIIKCCGCQPGKAIIVNETCSGHPITATDDKHRKHVDNLIQNYRRITQKRIANHIGTIPPMILQHDNACPHTSCATEEALRNLKFELIPHPPYPPNIAYCDFYIFPLIKRVLKGNHYTSDYEVKAAIASWIRENSE
ncbi:hypothetical protein J437_LFUL013939, partial [Ladona fulva]